MLYNESQYTKNISQASNFQNYVFPSAICDLTIWRLKYTYTTNESSSNAFIINHYSILKSGKRSQNQGIFHRDIIHSILVVKSMKNNSHAPWWKSRRPWVRKGNLGQEREKRTKKGRPRTNNEDKLYLRQESPQTPIHMTDSPFSSQCPLSGRKCAKS